MATAERIKHRSEPELKRSRETLEQQGGRWRLVGEEEVLPAHSPPGLVPALENAIAIVEFLNRNPPHDASLVEISSALDISKSHAHSILKTLTHYGWLKFDNRSKSYRLYSGILSSASAVWRNPSLDIIRDRLSILPSVVEVPCTLAQPQQDGSFVLMHRVNAARMEVSLPIGHRYPRDAPAHMRAYLAWQPQEKIEASMRDWRPIAYSPLTILTPEALLVEIEATRRRGYARSVGEFTDGLMGLALPVFNREGEIEFIVNCASLVPLIGPIEGKVAAEMISAVVDIHRATLARSPADFHH